MLQHWLLVVVLCVPGFAKPELQFGNLNDAEHDGHTHRRVSREASRLFYPEEASADYWNNNAQSLLRQNLARKPNLKKAKNVIMFLGDGMSISTLTAARTRLGQLNGKAGEETFLSFEKFPYTGLSKTYCVDKQTPDSACTATAYLGGVKANEGTIGVTAAVPLGVCKEMRNTSNHVHSIAHRAQLAGLGTGLVTTMRVTHASPAGVYAHTAHRDWEDDTDVAKDDVDPTVCEDIASQLVNSRTGQNLNVILGGGRSKFLPKHMVDEEGNKGSRSDKQNLIKEWKRQKKSFKHEYVWNRSELRSVPKDTEYLLGLFKSSHFTYNLDRDPKADPSLAEMTESAIKVLSNRQNGYFLFVEGGRIDTAHHGNLPQKSLDETIEFSKAVDKALELTSLDETLIVVTSDHSHTMTISGYADRGNNIFGIAGNAEDGDPYATLSYANGPGYHKESNGKREQLKLKEMQDADYRFPALSPRADETHGSDDVAVFATGPFAHLFTGNYEQNYIAHAMEYVLCVSEGATACKDSPQN